MNTMDAIRARASYRGKFTSQPIPREDLMELLEAGYLAPSGCNTQTTRLIGVDDPALVRKLAEISGVAWAAGAPAAILVIACETPAFDGHCYHLEDASAATENLLLAIADKGYASTWVQGQIRGEKGREMGKLLGVPEEMQVLVYLPVGIPAEQLKRPVKKPLEERVWINGYGRTEG